MAYDPDHARYILTALAECDYSSASSLLELQLELTDEDAITHFGWLLDLGYVEGVPETTANSIAPIDFYELRLTGQGALFLETFKNQSFYSTIKRKAVEIGCGQMPNMLMMVAERYVTGGS